MDARRGRDRELLPRPPKKIEYEIRFATADAKMGWRDLVATIRNPTTETWDFLTRTPLAMTPTNYRLKGELGTISRGGATYERTVSRRRHRVQPTESFHLEGPRLASGKVQQPGQALTVAAGAENSTTRT